MQFSTDEDLFVYLFGQLAVLMDICVNLLLATSAVRDFDKMARFVPSGNTDQGV